MVRLDFDLDDFFGMVYRFRYGGGWWRQDVPMSLRGCLIRALKLWTRLSEVPCCLTSVFKYDNLARELLVLGHL